MVERINIPQIIVSNFSQLVHRVRNYNQDELELDEQWSKIEQETVIVALDEFRKANKEVGDSHRFMHSEDQEN